MTLIGLSMVPQVRYVTDRLQFGPVLGGVSRTRKPLLVYRLKFYLSSFTEVTGIRIPLGVSFSSHEG